MFEFKLRKKDKYTQARIGSYETPHGTIQTPCFMPVGTKGVVKTITAKDLSDLNTEIMLSNTYHLHLRPTSELIKKMGGLHKWIGWDKPILTDSGGFQVFSLNQEKYGKDKKDNLVKITDKGVEFRSYLDGSRHFFSPERAIEIQHNLGADIIMAFDECINANSSRAYTEKSIIRTHQWLERCVNYHKSKKTNQALFGIIQGGVFEDLREESSIFIQSQDIDGLAIGGLSVGETKDVMYKIVKTTTKTLNEDKIRYLMGVGDPIDLLECIALGIDIFDCVLPTRLARHGVALTKNGTINILNAKHQYDNSHISSECECECCQNYNKSYLRHLFKEGEITGMKLFTIHNLHFIFDLINEARSAIEKDQFQTLLEKYRKSLTS